MSTNLETKTLNGETYTYVAVKTKHEKPITLVIHI